VDLTNIPEAKNLVLKWRGKPIVIRHRTSTEIAEAEGVNVSELRDPEPDSARVQKPGIACSVVSAAPGW
jgi:ubiquinol-cytochrome c reductase iron-sulfur subunit